MNKKGLTMVMLIITIIVLVIVSSVVVIKTDNLTSDAKALKLFNNMVLIKNKVQIEMYNMEDYEPQGEGDTYQYKGELLTNYETINEETYPLTDEEGQWYRFSDDTITYPNAVSLEQIGVKGVEGTFLVNYITGNIVSKEGILVDNERYHTLESLATLYNLDV